VLAEGRVSDLLAEDGAVRLRIRGLTGESLDRIVSAVKEAGGRVEDLEEGKKTLESFFIEILQKGPSR